MMVADPNRLAHNEVTQAGGITSRYLVRTACVTLLYFATAQAGLMFAVVGNTVTLVWPPSGIALVAILIYGYRMSVGIAAGAFLANAWVGTSLPHAAGIAVGNTLEALIGVFLLRGLADFRITLDRRQDVFAIILLAAVFSTAIGALLGAVTLSMGDMIPAGDAPSVWLKWWLGDMMGVLVVAPPLLIWYGHSLPVFPRLKKIEAASLCAAILVVGHLIFGSPEWAGRGYYPAAFALFPFVIWGALRFDHWGASLVTLVISILAIWGTSHGSGPFATDSSVDNLVRWCTFVNVVAMTGLLLSASSAQQHRAQTELKRSHEQLEQRVRERTDELTRMNANLVQEVAERNRQNKFLAAASHDLRQPIHAQGLFLDVLSRTPLSAYQSKVVASAQSAWLASSDMLNALLDFSRIEAGVVQPNVQPFNLQGLLHQIENDLAPIADAKGLVYRSRETTVPVQSDATLVGMILRNLVSNAIRYTRQGGVLVAGRIRRDMVVMEVWDTGIGIAPADQQDIFREFHQLENSEGDRQKGLGLGLAIADGLAKSLGHHLSLVSKPGRGSVFRLELPVSRTAVAPASTPPSRRHLQDVRVLVVDDDAAVRSAMTHLLQSWGCQCDAADSFSEALALAHRQAPALVISDYRLRGMRTGAHVITEVRRLVGVHTPALIITGDTAPERLREALASGIPLLHKPIAPEQLYRALVEVMG